MPRSRRVPRLQFIQQQKTSVPAPRMSVSQVVSDYEDTIIQPPQEFRHRPIPTPRRPPVPTPRTTIPPPLEFEERPTPAPRKSVKQIVHEFEYNIIPTPIRI